MIFADVNWNCGSNFETAFIGLLVTLGSSNTALAAVSSNVEKSTSARRSNSSGLILKEKLDSSLLPGPVLTKLPSSFTIASVGCVPSNRKTNSPLFSKDRLNTRRAVYYLTVKTLLMPVMSKTSFTVLLGLATVIVPPQAIIDFWAIMSMRSPAEEMYSSSVKSNVTCLPQA